MTTERLAAIAHEVYGSAAQWIAARDPVLRCERCGRERMPSMHDLARYMQRGWPECCGMTMVLETEEHADEPQSHREHREEPGRCKCLVHEP